MCNEEEFEMNDEIQVLFSEDIEMLEDHLTDIILTMGLPEEQTNAVLRLISVALEDHHANILDTYEDVLVDAEDDEVSE